MCTFVAQWEYSLKQNKGQCEQIMKKYAMHLQSKGHLANNQDWLTERQFLVAFFWIMELEENKMNVSRQQTTNSIASLYH